MTPGKLCYVAGLEGATFTHEVTLRNIKDNAVLLAFLGETSCYLVEKPYFKIIESANKELASETTSGY